jgi:uncharacterized protein
MSDELSFDPIPLLARELEIDPHQVAAVIELLAEGGTVPFIARYRKERTGGLDEVKIRQIAERRDYLVELEQRRQGILTAIEEQGKLSDDLRRQILVCGTKAELEDLYLPYKKKRRTKGMIAIERGLEALARRVVEQPIAVDPQLEARSYVNAEKELPDVDAALLGARQIVAEWIAEHAQLRGYVRTRFARDGVFVSEPVAKVKETRTKFEQYYGHREKVAEIPSHRYLALRRGEREKVLRVQLEADREPILAEFRRVYPVMKTSGYAPHLQLAMEDAYERLVAPSVENDVRADLKDRSDEVAVDVFATNFHNLLLASPFGARPVVGIDPGLRTGSKCVALDATGRFLATTTIYIAVGDDKRARAKIDLAGFISRHKPHAIAIGNGTGGRETEAFVRETLKEATMPEAPIVVQVGEAGASVYSASEIAREEFPDLDLTIRGAISIGRRLQDPLAELVKIEPKAIGVGQYQHDVHQPLLQRKLDQVVESCVNQVGVEVNTASEPLLARVAGIGPSLAKRIVHHRQKHGTFSGRSQLLKVSGLGPKTFEQAAGFLRVRESTHPLDKSAVHPERYSVVERMARELDVPLAELVGCKELIDRIDPLRYLSTDLGEPTLRDILGELRKPGRDPRQDFVPPKFRADVQAIEDLKQGMRLQGVVTNVTAFGAFVDLGVHQDGLVHISQLADRFVKDPHEVVQVGDRLEVQVLEVDLERRRIALTARRGELGDSAQAEPREAHGADRGRRSSTAESGRQDKRGAKRQDASDQMKGAGRAGARDEGRRDPRVFSNNPFAALGKPKE